MTWLIVLRESNQLRPCWRKLARFIKGVIDFVDVFVFVVAVVLFGVIAVTMLLLFIANGFVTPLGFNIQVSYFVNLYCLWSFQVSTDAL